MPVRPYISTQLSVSDDRLHLLTELTVMLNSRSVTAQLSQSICRTPCVNRLDGRLPLVTTSVGDIRIVGQGRCEREDRLRQEGLVLGGRKALL
jgi:hypothetical protein